MLYLDSCYNSPHLTQLLGEYGIGVTGMIRDNRKGMPNKKLLHHNSNKCQLYTVNNINLCLWKDKKTLKCLTNLSNN